ncbi:MAG: sugar phosphate isomerase/epimerase [Clostridia bacterium]|nr:sugar phosphate isomerase/epimerase [Clostridia bacterium]
MEERKIGISVGNGYRVPTSELVKLLGKIGFGGIAPSMPLDGSEFDIEGIVKSAKECGLSIPFVHAPFLNAAALWQDAGEKGSLGEEEILRGLALCHRYEIPSLVVHAWIGFFPSDGPTALGFERMDRAVRAAEKYGVSMALENTEGEEYLDALLSRYEGNASVGFCFDSGHEQCYNRGRDLLSQYGDRLLVTHLNDNLGISDPKGSISPMDDLHLLPFDGIIDWEKTAKRLAASRLPEILNFELNIVSKPGRHENDAYEKMTYEQYFSEAFRRAERIRASIECAMK